MFKRTFAKGYCLILLLSFGVAAPSFAGNDSNGSGWSDDTRPRYRPIPANTAENDMPPVAPALQRAPSSRLAQGGYLTGSATATVTSPPPPMTQINIPRNLPPRYNAGAASFGSGADANSFLLNAKQDSVVPPGMLKGWLDSTHPEFRLMAQNDPMRIIEVKGSYDHAGVIMTAMGIRSQTVSGKELRNVLSDNTKVLVVNCEGKIRPDDFEMVRQWVIHGGYLISTDWTLHSLVERAFPGMIAWNGMKTKGTTVDAVITAHDASLVAGANVGRAAWKCDDESQEVRVLRPDVVDVLARSYILGQNDPNRRFTQDPNQLGVLACDFPYGRGRVLQLVGHFDYNSGYGFNRYLLVDAIPGRGVSLRQAIATNFLMQGLQHGANNQ